jgi:hypothetical protein
MEIYEKSSYFFIEIEKKSIALINLDPDGDFLV